MWEEWRIFKVLVKLKKRWPLLLLLGSSPVVLVLGVGLSNPRLSSTQRPAEAKPWRPEVKRYLEANDYVKAEQLLQKAAEAGDADAMDRLGQLHLYGWGVPQDSAQARRWYQKAAEGGDSEAMYGLGWLYEHGWGGERDFTLARRWYQKAAAAGNAKAKEALSRLPKK